MVGAEGHGSLLASKMRPRCHHVPVLGKLILLYASVN